MIDNPEFDEFHGRLAAFERRLAATRARIGGAGEHGIPAHHRPHLDEIAARKGSLEKILERSRGAAWEEAKEELEAEWAALVHAFERWAERVDQEFGGKG